jgi:hypothetical protein
VRRTAIAIGAVAATLSVVFAVSTLAAAKTGPATSVSTAQSKGGVRDKLAKVRTNKISCTIRRAKRSPTTKVR